MNNLIFKMLIDKYNELCYTHLYIFGYIDRGNVYVSFTNSDILPYVCCLDKASRNQGYSLRFKPTKLQKEILKMQKSFILCSKDFFVEYLSNSKYNSGEVFEKLITEYYNQEWIKDSIPFTESGDIVINKVHYQIKFEKATFINEKFLTRRSGKNGN